jgi:hypothetical protein
MGSALELALYSSQLTQFEGGLKRGARSGSLSLCRREPNIPVPITLFWGFSIRIPTAWEDTVFLFGAVLDKCLERDGGIVLAALL